MPVAEQLGYRVESVRSWVRQADVDDVATPDATTAEMERLKLLEQENRELRHANEILRRASAFFAAELDGPQRCWWRLLTPTGTSSGSSPSAACCRRHLASISTSGSG